MTTRKTTRQALLEAAGPVFAQKGYARATAKEICQLAGADLAAVNYHYGSKDGLYQAVLVEAHRQLVSVDELKVIAETPGTPEQRLERLVRTLLGRVNDKGRSWSLQVLVHEILAPTEHAPQFARKAVLPKVQLVFGLIGGVLGLPPDHATVQRAVALVVLPCIMLMVIPATVRQIVLPAVAKDAEATVEDVLAYLFAGLAALRARHGG